jgi:uncharacterized protein (TIGR01777 family)
MLGSDVDFVEEPSGVPPPAVLSRCDAVINLVGSPLVGRRWTKRRLAEAEESRVGTTKKLVEVLRRASTKPRVLISASAVGYYGDVPETESDESRPAGQDYLGRLCRRWERAALRAESAGVRVVITRFGVVLSRFAGMLEVLEPLFRCRLGGRFGSGEAGFSWIHIDDLTRAMTRILDDDRLSGPINVTAPRPEQFGQFVDLLSKALGVAAPWKIPSPIIRVLLADGATSLLGGQRAIPKRLVESGFAFEFPDLESALADFFAPADLSISHGVKARDAFGDLGFEGDDDRSGILMQSATSVNSPTGDVFEFYSSPANLAIFIPPRIPFRVIDPPAFAEDGIILTYETGRPPFAKTYRGKLFGIVENSQFFDKSVGASPFEWIHRHRFVPNARGGTEVLDDLWVWHPGGRVIRRPAESVIRWLFEYRSNVCGWRFGRSLSD